MPAVTQSSWSWRPQAMGRVPAKRSPRNSIIARSANAAALQRRQAARALNQLCEIYRAPVVLRDIQGLSTEEASAVLGVKPQTLKSRLHRGRLILREHMGEFAGALTLHADRGSSMTSKPVVTVGRFTSPDLMVSRIRRGLTDFIGAKTLGAQAQKVLPGRILTDRNRELFEATGDPERARKAPASGSGAM